MRRQSPTSGCVSLGEAQVLRCPSHRAVRPRGSWHKSTMTDRPTQIERAFAIAASGTVSNTQELKAKLRSEGYRENGQVYGRTMMAQLTKLIADAKAKSDV